MARLMRRIGAVVNDDLPPAPLMEYGPSTGVKR
jgi:hypothetical protein